MKYGVYYIQRCVRGFESARFLSVEYFCTPKMDDHVTASLSVKAARRTSAMTDEKCGRLRQVWQVCGKGNARAHQTAKAPHSLTGDNTQ